MTDIWLPDWLKVARASVRYIDSSAVYRNPYTGIAQVVSLGGDRLGGSLNLAPQGGVVSPTERRAMTKFMASLRGRQNRFFVTDAAYRRGGNFPTNEVLPNNTFLSGTSGWSINLAGESILSASDRELIVTRAANTSAYVVQRTSSVTVTQFAPYVGRVFVRSGSGPYSGDGQVFIDSVAQGSLPTAPGLITAAFVAQTTAPTFQFADYMNGKMAGNYFIVPYTSLSRCALVDNGENRLLQSAVFGNASWTKTNVSAGTNDVTAPDGTATGDSITENASAGVHAVSQGSITVPSAAADFAFCVAIKAAGRSFAYVTINEATGGTGLSQYFNLSGSGTVGASGATGANWANRRAFARSLGNGWVMCCLVGRKTNAATTLSVDIGAATADGTSSYTGTSAHAISLWRATLAQSGVPVQLVSTTTTAITSPTQTGSGLRLKGLPVSATDLLLPGDQFEVITSFGSELKIVDAVLNSDSAGLGHLQFHPPLRATPAVNAPVIIHNPMGRFMFDGQFPEWANDPGYITSTSIEFEEG